MKKALQHNFESTIDIMDLSVVVGYQTCLADLCKWINDTEKAGYVISGDLLIECIVETTKELKEINNLSNEIKSLLKP